MTPNERKQRLATFIRATDQSSSVMVDTRSGALCARINGTNYIWGNCPTFRQIRAVMGLPTDYIELRS